MRRWLMAGFGLAALGGLLGYEAVALYQAPGPLAKPTILIVPHGRLASVAEALAKGNLIGNTLFFRAAAWATARAGVLHAAEFAFPAHASLAQILDILRQGRPVLHTLTIPEGLTAAQIAALLARADGLEGEILVPKEGSVLPETYSYERGTQVTSLVARAQAAMAKALDQAWQSRAPNLPLRSAAEMLILASVVERETHLPAERPLVAAVFYNRLRTEMRLQSDPTVIFGQSGGTGLLPDGLSKAALATPSPYNSYTNPGLPAGPICSPGVKALEAVAHPALSDALYFVADGTGGHSFAHSLDEHAHNVQHYRALPHTP